MRPNATVPRQVNQAGRTARNAATSKWISWLARMGYAVKGVVYLIIGGLAAKLAIGQGGAATDQRGAIHIISDQPFGKFLLVIAGIGLIGYALWSLIQALFDTEGKGNSAKGILSRVGYAAVGVAYALLAFGTLKLATGAGNVEQSSTASTQDWTARLLQLPFGIPLVVIVGLVVLGLALYLYSQAYKASF